MPINRPSWDEYFMNITREVAKRSTCNRLDVGAVIVKDKRIISTGYVGSPKGLPHCIEIGCLIRKTLDENGKEKENCIRTVHAEQNAVVQAALHGVSTENSTIYITDEPCPICTKIIINAGINRVVCGREYHDAGLSRSLLKEAGVKLEIVKPL